MEAAEHDRLVKEAFLCYRKTLPDDLKALLNRYEVKDVAIKVVGVGSVGTRCAILLMIAGDDDPLFLQVKEVHESVLEPYAGKSVYPNCGQRVVVGQRLMQAASDIFLGWTEQWGRHFYGPGSYAISRSNLLSKFSIRVHWRIMVNGVDGRSPEPMPSREMPR